MGVCTAKDVAGAVVCFKSPGLLVVRHKAVCGIGSMRDGCRNDGRLGKPPDSSGWPCRPDKCSVSFLPAQSEQFMYGMCLLDNVVSEVDLEVVSSAVYITRYCCSLYKWISHL